MYSTTMNKNTEWKRTGNISIEKMDHFCTHAVKITWIMWNKLSEQRRQHFFFQICTFSNTASLCRAKGQCCIHSIYWPISTLRFFCITLTRDQRLEKSNWNLKEKCYTGWNFTFLYTWIRFLHYSCCTYIPFKELEQYMTNKLPVKRIEVSNTSICIWRKIFSIVSIKIKLKRKLIAVINLQM